MHNSPSTAKIFLYQMVTLGIYFLVWSHRLGNDLSAALKRKAVPSMWWFIIPGGSYYWVYRMAESLEIATGKRIKMTNTFLLYVLLVTLPLSVLAGMTDFDSDANTSSSISSVIFIIILVVAGIAILAILLTHAAFSAIIQSKLNKVRSNS